jgi:hypothetical protein
MTPEGMNADVSFTRLIRLKFFEIVPAPCGNGNERCPTQGEAGVIRLTWQLSPENDGKPGGKSAR